jgi:hypothetical protein
VDEIKKYLRRYPHVLAAEMYNFFISLDEHLHKIYERGIAVKEYFPIRARVVIEVTHRRGNFHIRVVAPTDSIFLYGADYEFLKLLMKFMDSRDYLCTMNEMWESLPKNGEGYLSYADGDTTRPDNLSRNADGELYGILFFMHYNDCIELKPSIHMPSYYTFRYATKIKITEKGLNKIKDRLKQKNRYDILMQMEV